MAVGYNPRIVTDGLVLALDAANTKSYVGSGNTWTDLSGKGNNGTINGAVHFGPNPTVSSAYSVSAVNGGTADFTSSPDGSNTAIFSNIFDGTNSTGFYNAQSNFDVTVTLVEPITYTSRTVSVYHATLNAVDFITTAGTVTAQTGGSSTGTFTYTNLLPAGGTLTGIRFYTLSSSNNTVVSITIDGELLNLFKPTPQISSYFDFDGTNDNCSLGPSSDFTPGTGPFTIEMWIYPTATPSQYEGPAYYTGSGVNNTSLFWAYRSGNLDLVNNGDSYTLLSMTYPTLNQWVHLVASRDASGYFAVYENGVVKASTTSNSDNYEQTEIYIGGSGAYRWPGKVSVFKMYKGKGLTAAEVQQNYNALRGRYGI